MGLKWDYRPNRPIQDLVWGVLLAMGHSDFKPKEPSHYPLALILLLLIALMTVPWYAKGPTFEKLVLSIPLWVWSVIIWSLILAFSIMAVARYLWRLEE